MKKPQAFGSSYFIGKSHFEEDGTQNCLVFQPINKYFKGINNSEYVLEWKSKGVSDKSINLLLHQMISLILHLVILLIK